MNSAAFSPLFGPFCAFMSSVTWACGSAMYSVLATKHSPFAVNFGRAIVSFPLYLLLALLIQPAAFRLVGPEHIAWFAISMVSSYALADVLFLLSVRSLGLPGALAIASTFPLWSALAGWCFKGERLGAGQLIGLLAIVLGTVLVILSHKQSDARVQRGLNKVSVGVALGTVTSLLWALNTYAVAHAGTGVPTVTANAVRMGIAFVLCPIFGTIYAGPKSVWLGWKDFTVGLPMFLVESFAGSFFYMYGLTHASLAVASSLSSLSPVLSVPIALVMGWEKPSLMRASGVVSVVGGICLLVRGS